MTMCLLVAVFLCCLAALHGFQAAGLVPRSGLLNAWEAVPAQADDKIGIGLEGNHASMADLIRPAGYVLEEYVVESADGYLLSLYRMPFGKHEAGSATGKQVVLLQHALLDCSASWAVNGPGQALAFVLADAGFDVWMSNSRGNTFSREHKWLSPDDEAFWAFSWDEMARLDLPATIDFVLAATGAARLAYVGHSQGTTIGFAALSEQPALADKVSLALMLAPVTFLGHVTSRPVVAMAEMETDKMFQLLGAKEFLPQREVSSGMYADLCSRAAQYCMQAIEAICGRNQHNIDASKLPLYLKYAPAGTSVQNMVHWAQGVRRKLEAKPRFAKYDYGQECFNRFGQKQPCNQDVYGTLHPPTYNLSSIATPLAIFSGGEDLLSDAQDIGSLTSALPPQQLVFVEVQAHYDHLAFTWAVDAHLVLYPTIVRLLRQHAA